MTYRNLLGGKSQEASEEASWRIVPTKKLALQGSEHVYNGSSEYHAEMYTDPLSFRKGNSHLELGAFKVLMTAHFLIEEEN